MITSLSDPITLNNPETYSRASIEVLLADLPSNYTYTLLYLFSHQQIGHNKTPPLVLTYLKLKDMTILDLKEQYIRQIKSNQSPEKVRFEMQEGTQLESHIQLSEIRRRLRLQTIQGMPIFLKKISSFEDECCMVSLIESERAFYQEGIEICFSLPNKQSIYLNVVPKSNFDSLRAELAKEIKRVFAFDLNPLKVSLKCDGKRNEDINYKRLAKEDVITVELTVGVALPEVSRQNNSYLVIKGQGVKTTRLSFDEIRLKKTKDVFNQIEYRSNWESFGLKVNEIILKPNDKIEKLANMFTNSTIVCRNIAGTIISESQMFKLEQQKIKQSGKVDLSKIAVSSKDNSVLQKECKDKIVQRAKKTTHDYFKNKEQFVEPILIYTSQIQVLSSINKQKGSIYNNLNKFLREKNFAHSGEEQYQKWEYQFANELIQQLKQIQPSLRKGKGQELWRGVGYDFDKTVGSVLSFKQFLSTSSKYDIGKSFAYSALFKITNSYSSKSIKDFSFYSETEGEYLFEPYTDFKIVSVGKIKGCFDDMIDLVELEELAKPTIEEETTLVLLWVDDKTMEGRQMWDSLKDIHKTAIMVQLMTTQELTTWLQKNTKIINDSSIELVMITNMTRIEDGTKVDEAGVSAIKEYRKVKPDGQIYVYIGWVEGTLNKLQKHNYVPNQKLHVSNIEQDLRNFLRKINLQ